MIIVDPVVGTILSVVEYTGGIIVYESMVGPIGKQESFWKEI